MQKTKYDAVHVNGTTFELGFEVGINQQLHFTGTQHNPVTISPSRGRILGTGIHVNLSVVYPQNVPMILK